VVSHETECHGGEPLLDAYFFARVAPLLDGALAAGPDADWPLITLNLDFKTNEPEHHRAVWTLLERHRRWLTTAERVADGATVAPLAVGPLLVLTGANDVQQQTFHDAVPAGGRLLVFGAIHGIAGADPDGLPRATPATGGTIRGASPSPEASARPGPGRRTKPRGCGRWCPTRTPGVCGSASTRSTGIWARARAGRTATTSARRRQPRSAGAPPATPAWTSLPRINTQNWRRY
jgi:hypothetical protein